MKDVELFRDAGERLRYHIVEREVAKLRAEPFRVEDGRRHFQARLRYEIGNPKAVAAWERLLDQSVDCICERLLAFDGEARLLRETRPAFVVLSPHERAEVVEEIRAYA